MWKKIIGSIVVFIIVVFSIVMYATSGMSDTANEFFIYVKSKHYDDAYNMLSEDFKKSTSKEIFENFLKNSALTDYKSVSWNERSIDGSTGTLSGTVHTESGDSIPITIKFIKTKDDKWKIYSITKPVSGIKIKDDEKSSSNQIQSPTPTATPTQPQALIPRQPQTATPTPTQPQTLTPRQPQTATPTPTQPQTLTPRQPQTATPTPTQPQTATQPQTVTPTSIVTPRQVNIPSRQKLIALIQETMMIFAKSVNEKSMKRVYDYSAKLFQNYYTLDKLNKAFQSFYKANVDLTVLKDITPIIDQGPIIKAGGRYITVKGHYPTSPSVVYFKNSYYLENGKWKLISIGVNIK